MGFKDIVRKSELDSISDDAYDYIAQEMKNGIRDEGMWIKALAIANGDEGRALPEYIKLRFNRLAEEQREEELKRKRVMAKRAEEKRLESLAEEHMKQYKEEERKRKQAIAKKAKDEKYERLAKGHLKQYEETCQKEQLASCRNTALIVILAFVALVIIAMVL